jgi:hypothetical protein
LYQPLHRFGSTVLTSYRRTNPLRDAGHTSAAVFAQLRQPSILLSRSFECVAASNVLLLRLVCCFDWFAASVVLLLQYLVASVVSLLQLFRMITAARFGDGEPTTTSAIASLLFERLQVVLLPPFHAAFIQKIGVWNMTRMI